MKEHKEKTATSKPSRKIQSKSFPHSPQKEPVLLTPWFLTCSLQYQVAMGRSLQSSRGNTAWKVRLWFFLFWDPLKFTQGFHWSFCHLIVVKITGPETKVQDQVRSATPQLKADSSTKCTQIRYLSDAWRVHKSFHSALGGRKVDQGENPEQNVQFPKY